MYPKAVKERRLQKSSHFMEEIDMKSITPATHTNLASRVHPSHPAHRSHPSHTSHHTHPTHPTVMNPELESNRIYVPNIRYINSGGSKDYSLLSIDRYRDI